MIESLAYVSCFLDFERLSHQECQKPGVASFPRCLCLYPRLASFLKWVEELLAA